MRDDADDLAPLTTDVKPKPRKLPEVTGTKSYLRERIDDQITNYDKPRAADLRQEVRPDSHRPAVAGRRRRRAGVAAAIFETDDVAVWLPVVTTIGAALAAYGAAERYDFQVVEFLRTADQLERLRNRRGPAATMSDDELIRAAEQVISVQNEGWMAKLSSEPET